MELGIFSWTLVGGGCPGEVGSLLALNAGLCPELLGDLIRWNVHYPPDLPTLHLHACYTHKLTSHCQLFIAVEDSLNCHRYQREFKQKLLAMQYKRNSASGVISTSPTVRICSQLVSSAPSFKLISQNTWVALWKILKCFEDFVFTWIFVLNVQL